MPKGVEHFRAWWLVVGMCGVNLPLMPKGVEHVILPALAPLRIGCEPTSDAERR